jgi:ubiquinol-cytochrome c reductase iron-sulfur subunit
VLRRGPEMLERLANDQSSLKDPDSLESLQPAYAQNPVRSLKPEYLVVIGNCTHLGCAPLERFEVAPADLGADWVGGFYCPCHGSKFDLAARVMSGSPAPTNLVVPPHRYASDSLIIIGEESGAAA